MLSQSRYGHSVEEKEVPLMYAEWHPIRRTRGPIAGDCATLAATYIEVVIYISCKFVTSGTVDIRRKYLCAREPKISLI